LKKRFAKKIIAFLARKNFGVSEKEAMDHLPEKMLRSRIRMKVLWNCSRIRFVGDKCVEVWIAGV